MNIVNSRYKMGTKTRLAQLRLLCLFSTFLVSAGAAVIADANAADSTAVQNSAVPTCVYYDRFLTRGGENPSQSTCDTVFPEFGGLRKTLSESGWGIQVITAQFFTYDILGLNRGTNSYNGEQPSYIGTVFPIFTYDLARWGLNEKSQITIEPSLMYTSFDGNGPSYVNLAQLSAFLPFWDDRLTVQAGYYAMGDQFYGGAIGNSFGGSALSTTSSLMFQLGVKGFRTKPGIDVRLYSEDKRWYNHIGVTRANSPEGPFEDFYDDRIGFKFTSPGAKPVWLDEVGYRVDSAPGQKKFWLRAGAIYNTSNYYVLDGSGDTEHNYGFYAVGDFQLTQPNPELAYQGWGIQAKVGIGDDKLNAISKEFGATLYKLGTFESRPADVFAIGYMKSYYSDTLVNASRAGGLDPETEVNVYSTSYTARLGNGAYLQTGLTYTDHPTFVPKRDGVLNLTLGLLTIF